MSDIAHLSTALVDPSVQAIQLTNWTAPSNQSAQLEVQGTKSLDLDGVDLQVSNVVVDADTSFTVTDSQYSAASGSTGQLEVNPVPDSGGAYADGGTAVLLKDGSALNVSGAAVSADGTVGGAGIGSNDDSHATVAASAGAYVDGEGGTLPGSNGDAGGGAGIGGSNGHDGVTVEVADADTSVYGYGGAGAAGIGGGYGGSGGHVHVAGGTLSASQSSAVDSESLTPASAIGGGEGPIGPTAFGSLQIDAGGDLELYNGDPLYLPAGATVENAGTIGMTNWSRGAAAQNQITGAGTIHNLGTVKAYTGGLGPSTPVAVDAFIASTVKVTGYNYDVAVDANGGAVTGASATSGRVLSASLSDLLGSGYSVAAPSTDADFWKWNTNADGSGTDVADGTDGDLAALGVSSDGTPVSAALHARFAAHPVATATSLPDGTVGTAYHAALPITGDDLSYAVEYGASASSAIPGLPDGLAIDPSTGVISGTPTEAVNQDVVFYVNGPRFGDDFTYHLIVAPAPVVAPAPPTSTPPTSTPAPTAPSLPAVPNTTVKLGHDLHLVVTAKSSVPVTYSLASGTLPKGVQLDPATGVISGSPSESGFFSVVVKATSSAGTASTPVIIVVPEVKDLLSTKNAVPAVKVGASTVPLKVGGLEKGEHWTLKVDGRLVHRGTMKKAGTLSVSVHLGKALHDKVHTIVISGSRKVADAATRAATTVTITSLAAKKKLTVHEVSANGMKLVAVEKLAAGEHVVVKDGSKVIASGHASEYGIFAFPQSKAGKGTSTLTVHGAAAKRSGTLTVKNPKH